jgi:hypothetical protein
VQQLDPVGVDHGEEGRVRQEGVGPGLVRPQGAQQAGALGQVPEQARVVARQPAVEAAERAALQGEQQPDRDEFAGPQPGLRVPARRAEPVRSSSTQNRRMMKVAESPAGTAGTSLTGSWTLPPRAPAVPAQTTSTSG